MITLLESNDIMSAWCLGDPKELGLRVAEVHGKVVRDGLNEKRDSAVCSVVCTVILGTSNIEPTDCF
jgi:hypothetical protein